MQLNNIFNRLLQIKLKSISFPLISRNKTCVCYLFGRDRMVVGFTTTCATNAYYH